MAIDDLGREYFVVKTAPGRLGISLGENKRGFVVVRGIDALSSTDLEAWGEADRARVKLLRQTVQVDDRLVAIEGDDTVHCSLHEIIGRLGKLSAKSRQLTFARYHSPKFDIKDYDVEKLVLVRAPSGPLGLILSDTVRYGAVVEGLQTLPDGLKSCLASIREVHCGCQLVRVNETDVSAMSREEVQELLASQREQEKELVLYRAAPSDCVGFSLVEYPSREKGDLGFTMDETEENRSVVAAVNAAVVGTSVLAGDVLMAVNGVDVTCKSRLEAIEAVQQAPFPRTLYFYRCKPNAWPECHQLLIAPGPSGLNLDSNNPEHARIEGFTTAADANRPAFANCADFIPGSYIIAVNKLDVFGCSLASISQLMLKLRNVEREVVVGNAALLESLQRAHPSMVVQVMPGPLGMLLDGSHDGVARVSGFVSVADGQPGTVERSGRVPVGSVLQSINEMNISCLPLAQITSLLKKLSATPKKLGFSSPLTTKDGTARVVNVRVPSGPLGVDLKGGDAGEVVVDRVNQDPSRGPIHMFKHGGVVSGSKMLAIDGFDLRSLGITEVTQLLRALAVHEKVITFSSTVTAYSDMLSPDRKPSLKRVVVTRSPMGIQFDSSLVQEAVVSGYTATTTNRLESPRDQVEDEIPVGSHLVAIENVDVQALSLHEVVSVLKSFAGLEKTLTFDTVWDRGGDVCTSPGNVDIGSAVAAQSAPLPTAPEVAAPLPPPAPLSSLSIRALENVKSNVALGESKALVSKEKMSQSSTRTEFMVNLTSWRGSHPLQCLTVDVARNRLQISPAKAAKELKRTAIAFQEITALGPDKTNAPVKKGLFRSASFRKDVDCAVLSITTVSVVSGKKKSKTWELSMRSQGERDELVAILKTIVPALQSKA